MAAPTRSPRPAAVAGPRPAPAGLVAAALGAVYVLWGSTYLGIRVALDDVPPYTLGAIRFAIAGAVMYAVAIRLARRGGRSEPRPTARLWVAQALIGVLLLGIGNGGVILAEQSGVPTGLVALLIATVPLWMALIGGLVLGEPFSRRAVVSVLLGFAGVAVLIRPGGAAPLTVMLAVLIAPLTWSVGSLYARRAPRPRSPLLGAGMQMLAAAVAFAVVALAIGEPWHGGVHLTGRAVLAVAYLITFGSLVGYTAYAWLLQVAPVSLVSTYAYVNPLVAVLLGAVFLGESITARVLVGGGIVAVAVALLLSASGPRRSRATAEVVGAPAQLPGRVAACAEEELSSA